MPEIEILRVIQDGDDPIEWNVENAAGAIIHDNDPNFGVNDLVALGAEYGITRWAEATDKDRAEFDKVSFVADRLVLVGWAEAPISRDDVEDHAERSEALPAVNIKVHDPTLPNGNAWTELVDEFRDDLDSRLTGLSDDGLRDLVQAFLEKDTSSDIFWDVCRQGFEEAAERAELEFFKDYKIKVWAQGRSGGWLVVEGLPPIREWGVKLLTQWQLFTMFCADQVKDVPRAMAWQVLANQQDVLAGRVVRVELTMVLSDEDLAEVAEDPTEWDWRGMLDLSVDSTITARNLNS